MSTKQEYNEDALADAITDFTVTTILQNPQAFTAFLNEWGFDGIQVASSINVTAEAATIKLSAPEDNWTVQLTTKVI